MREKIRFTALVIAAAILGWAWGNRKRTEEELNTVYYPTLYSEVIRAIDPETNQSVDFDIKWHEKVTPSLKGTEPTRVLKHPDNTQSVTLVRRFEREQYSFDIHASGYKPHKMTIKPARRHLHSNFDEEVIEVALTPVEAKIRNTPNDE